MRNVIPYLDLLPIIRSRLLVHLFVFHFFKLFWMKRFWTLINRNNKEMASIIEQIKGGIVVSCQAHEEDGLYGPENMALMAKAAELGGAVGIRADDPNHIAAIRRTVKLPIIGIYKEDVDGYATRITLNMDRVRDIFEAGSDIIALDCTHRPHPYNTNGFEMIKQIKEKFGCLVMADISNFEEGVAAANAGADIVATTLAGYTDYTPHTEGPDFDLVRRLAAALSVPVICEGRIAAPEHARRLLRMGAHAIVVGSMITRPMWITKQYADMMKKTVKALHATAYALDIGGTKIAASIVNAKGELLEEPLIVSCPQESSEAVVTACIELLNKLKSGSSYQPSCVGISTGGTINTKGEIIYATSSIPNWQGTPLASMIEKEMKLPVVVCNDGNCAAIAESRIGEGKNKKSCLCLTVGTGLGGGFTIDEQLVCGSDNMAQCFGHMIVNKDGRSIGENEGAAESYISGRALCLEYNRLVSKENQVATGKEVGDLALNGNKEAVEAVRIVGEWLGLALASMCACLNPQVVSIGGSVGDLDALLLEPTRASFRKHAFATIRDTPIVKAALGNNAGMVGAALLALEKC